MIRRIRQETAESQAIKDRVEKNLAKDKPASEEDKEKVRAIAEGIKRTQKKFTDMRRDVDPALRFKEIGARG